MWAHWGTLDTCKQFVNIVILVKCAQIEGRYNAYKFDFEACSSNRMHKIPTANERNKRQFPLKLVFEMHCKAEKKHTTYARTTNRAI